MRSRSRLEDAFAAEAKRRGLDRGMVREYEFAKTIGRNWRADFCWPAARAIFECDGGVWIRNGRHTGSGREDDAVRDAAATLLGWRVFRVTPNILRSGACWSWLQSALSGVPVGILNPAWFPKPAELRPQRVRANPNRRIA